MPVKRPCPDDFLSLFGTMSQAKLASHYGAAPAAIRRWAIQCGVALEPCFDAAELERLRQLYADGKTLRECASELGKGLVTVSAMADFAGIAIRKGAPWGHCGERNGTWKGDDATYSGFHERVRRARGKACICTKCGSERAVQWANLTGRYADLEDYTSLCSSCHQEFDRARRKRVGRKLSAHVRKRSGQAPEMFIPFGLGRLSR